MAERAGAVEQAWALVGPTASGKSALAMDVAERCPVEILNLDAMQVFRGLDLGTAKPSVEERARVPHHLFDLREPEEPLGAGVYARLAAGVVEEVLARGRTPLFVGGTGFYLRVLRRGLAPVPEIAVEVRGELAAEVERIGLPALRAELERVDPAWAARVHPNDRQRIIRGLEVYRGTGRPLSHYLDAPREGRLEAPMRVFVVDAGPGVLRSRINARALAMLDAGLVDEVRTLLESGVPEGAHGFRAPGYREVLAHLRGELGAAALPEAIATAHRRYARRQRTFLRGEPDLLPVRDAGELVAAAEGGP